MKRPDWRSKCGDAAGEALERALIGVSVNTEDGLVAWAVPTLDGWVLVLDEAPA